VKVKKADIEEKRLREKQVVGEMISLYCRKNHGAVRKSSVLQGNAGSAEAGITASLCPECAELLAYAESRSDHCPFMAEKTFCSNCKVHCYKPEMREKIRQVMRFSGPRMMFYHPVMAIRHVMESKREAKRISKEG